jgi:hypothetical protein
MEKNPFTLVPEERELADALQLIANKYGKFDADNTGIWAGYTPASENEENAKIGVKCGNCVFYLAPNGCSIIVAEVEDGGLCRFAVLPDGAVNASGGFEAPEEVLIDELDILQATAGSKKAPVKDMIKGSDKNKKGSAADGKGVTFTEAITKALEKKVAEHNEKAPNGRKVTLAKLKAVYRRGAGAFSTSHRPDQNRNSWAMARVNAFLYLVKSGKPKNSKYTTDNDLLPKMHPRSSEASTMSPLMASLVASLNVADSSVDLDEPYEPWLF